MSSLIWKNTHCLFCAQSQDRELYPALLNPESLTGYTFSARRTRTREHYRVVACERCGLVRSDPVLDEVSLAGLYAESSFLFSEEEAYAAECYAQLLEMVVHRFNQGAPVKSLIEIGCSTGFFLERALAMGIKEVQGIEPSRDCVEHARPASRPFIVNACFGSGLLEGRSFDVACSFHVMDHLSRPDQTLAAMAELLSPGGFVLLACHDVAAWSARILGDRSPIFDVEHIYLFSQKTLTLLAERAGLRVLECASLTNRYPLGYWLRMAPGGRMLTKCLPRGILRLPVKLNAGNMYLVAQKDCGKATPAPGRAGAGKGVVPC
jgi:2-polyprenyl-3-methyl-5-hydroxy-6-metoxy-1,4-benzoquinol methylase